MINKKKIEWLSTKIIEWSFLGLLLIVPLFFDTRCRGVFDVPKVSLLRIFSLVIICAWLLRIILTNEFKFVKSKLDIPVLAFLLVSIASTIFSVDPFTSLVGAYKRHEGLTTTIIYVLLFFTATNFLHNNRRLLTQVVCVGIGGGVIASVYSFIQKAGRDPIHWAADVTGRAVSTFGNPIFLGAYSSILIPVALAYFFIKRDIQKTIEKKKEKKKKKGVKVGEKQTIKILTLGIPWVLAISLIIMYLALFFSGSRGPFVGLLVGIILFAILWGKKAFLYNRRRVIALGLGFFILSAYLWFQPGSLGERIITTLKTAKEEKGVMLEKVLTGEEGISESSPYVKRSWLTNKLIGALGNRYFVCRNSAIIIRHYPQDGPISGPLTFPYCGLVFGVGVDTMKWVYPFYELPGMEKLEGANVDYDRAHNEVFDIAVTRGLVGLAIYFWLLVTFIYLAIKGYRHTHLEEDKLLIAGFSSAWLTYVVQMQFAFAVVSFTPFYWTLMGMTMVVCGYTKLNQKEEKTTQKKPSFYIRLTPSQICMSILVIGIVCLLGYFSTLPYRADYYFNKGEKAIHHKDLDTALQMYEKAVQYNFRERHYYGELTYTYYKKADSIPMFQKELKEEWIKKTFNRIQDAFKVNPKDGYFYNILGATYALWYDVGSKTAKQKAIDAYHKASKYNIVFAEPLNNLGTLYSKDKEYDKAIEVYKKVAEMRPNEAQTQMTVGEMYFKKKDYKNAIKWIKKSLTIDPKLINAIHRLGEIYFEQGEFDESAKAFEEIVKIGPKNIDVHRSLGAAYFRAAENRRIKGKINEAIPLYYKAKSEYEIYLRYHPEDVEIRKIVDSMKR